MMMDSDSTVEVSPDILAKRNHLSSVLHRRLVAKLGPRAKGNEKWISKHIDEFVENSLGYTPADIDRMEKAIRYDIHSNMQATLEANNVSGGFRPNITLGNTRSTAWQASSKTEASRPWRDSLISTSPIKRTKKVFQSRHEQQTAKKMQTQRILYEPPASSYKPPRQKYDQYAPYFQQYEGYRYHLKPVTMPVHVPPEKRVKPPVLLPECIDEYIRIEERKKLEAEELEQRRAMFKDYKQMEQARDDAERKRLKRALKRQQTKHQQLQKRLEMTCEPLPLRNTISVASARPMSSAVLMRETPLTGTLGTIIRNPGHETGRISTALPSCTA